MSSLLELVAVAALLSVVTTMVQALMTRFLLKRLDNLLNAGARLAGQLELLLPSEGKSTPGPGERGRVPVAPGDQAESPGPGAGL